MKKALFQKIREQENLSFNLLHVKRPFFKVPWHFHPEIEIMLIINGEGTRFVGDSVSNFEPGDLVMIGPNLSHVWKNSDVHYESNPNVVAEAFVILFRADCFGKDFFQLCEMSEIMKLIRSAERGIVFSKNLSGKLSEKFIGAYNSPSVFEKFMIFLEILNQLSIAKEYSFLTSPGYLLQDRSFDLERLNHVLDYVMLHYRESISLEYAAKLAHMSVPAFCRYFKNRTNKTFIQFINELRIGYAHRRLIETQHSIVEICYECGYGQLSNFYKQFQLLSGCSPAVYRKAHEKKKIDFYGKNEKMDFD